MRLAHVEFFLVRFELLYIWSEAFRFGRTDAIVFEGRQSLRELKDEYSVLGVMRRSCVLRDVMLFHVMTVLTLCR
jgi:hypothetical protein